MDSSKDKIQSLQPLLMPRWAKSCSESRNLTKKGQNQKKHFIGCSAWLRLVDRLLCLFGFFFFLFCFLSNLIAELNAEYLAVWVSLPVLMRDRKVRLWWSDCISYRLHPALIDQPLDCGLPFRSISVITTHTSEAHSHLHEHTHVFCYL